MENMPSECPQFHRASRRGCPLTDAFFSCARHGWAGACCVTGGRAGTAVTEQVGPRPSSAAVEPGLCWSAWTPADAQPGHGPRLCPPLALDCPKWTLGLRCA